MRLFVPVAMLLMIAPACASEATSTAATAGTTTLDETDEIGTLPTDCHVVNSPPPPNVKVGDCGDFVVEVQTRLVDLGYEVSVNGLFDEATEDAVKDFQADSGRTVDGIVGPKTWAALSEGGVGD